MPLIHEAKFVVHLYRKSQDKQHELRYLVAFAISAMIVQPTERLVARLIAGEVDPLIIVGITGRHPYP